MGMLVILGYITMCKCCMVSTVFACFAPQIIRAYRTWTRPFIAMGPHQR